MSQSSVLRRWKKRHRALREFRLKAIADGDAKSAVQASREANALARAFKAYVRPRISAQ